MLHPHVQKRIQKDLDECIGVGGRPTMAEVQTFEYFKAAWHESMRLNATGALGIGHVNTEDDIYRGYFIPKGTSIFCNIGSVFVVCNVSNEY
jgi:cytochrome P450